MRLFLSLLLLWPAGVFASTAADEGLAVYHRVRSTHYTHDAYVDERRGVYNFDCSSFAKFVLDRSKRAAARELDEIAQGPRPLARDFVALFDSLIQNRISHTWEGVRYARHLRAGDLIAWLIPAGSTSTDTGHVMIVTGEPKRSPRFKNEWLVPVVDAAESGHGHTDPRRRAGPNGVGVGVVGIVVDAKDRPTGFYWSGGESSGLHQTTVRLARPR